MPLVRTSDKMPPSAATAPAQHPRDQLATGSADDRRRAAQMLAADPDAAPLLAERLHAEADPVVRDALFASLVAIGGQPVAALVAQLLDKAFIYECDLVV